MNTISSCEICTGLGSGVSANYLEAEKLPPETDQFVPVDGTDESVFQCPVCGAYFEYERKTDNDVYNLIDSAHFDRITLERVNSIKKSVAASIKREKDEIKKFRTKITNKFTAKKLKALPFQERRVVEYLIEKTYRGEYQERIGTDLKIDPRELAKVLENLETLEITSKRVYWPLGPDERNFQAEYRSEDPVPFTKYTLNDSPQARAPQDEKGQHPAVTTFFALAPARRLRALIFLCRFALGVWEDYCREEGKITYIETVVGTLQEVDASLPRDALESVVEARDLREVANRFNEPITAIVDRDLRFPANIQFAYHAIYNLFEKYVFPRGEGIDDWLIVEQALSATSDEGRWVELLQKAVDEALKS